MYNIMKDIPVIMDYDKCQIACVGDLHTGKTTLTKTYVEYGKYLPPETRLNSCMRIEYDCMIKTVDDVKVKMFIWDTAGQERFESILKSCYRNKDIVMIIYSVTNKLSFDNIKDIWYKQVKQYCHPLTQNSTELGKLTYKPIVILVGTKCDTVSISTGDISGEGAEHKGERQVSYEQGLSLADELDVPFFEVSAKNMTNVNELFDFCAMSYIAQKTQKIKVDRKDQSISQPNFLGKVMSYFSS